ncbi:MAG: glycosyltransferase, partial [Candidatus Hydrogenedentales bacterium]
HDAQSGSAAADLESMLFSVIIPTFNRLELLKAALQSIRDQSFSDRELIVVDDGSSDGTAEYVASLGGLVKCVRQDNAGPASARNAGARLAVGEFLVFLDSDDELLPGALAAYANVIAQLPRPAIIIGAWLETDGPVLVPPVDDRALTFTAFSDYFEAASRSRHFQSGSGVVRRDIFLAYGGFDEQLRCAEDQDLALRLGEQPTCVVVECPEQVRYRRHSASLTANVRDVIAGARAVVSREVARMYPGGEARQADRRQAILRLAVPVSIAAIAADRRIAWQLYRRLARWAVRAGRWKYVCGFPVLAFRAAMTNARG